LKKPCKQNIRHESTLNMFWFFRKISNLPTDRKTMTKMKGISGYPSTLLLPILTRKNIIMIGM
jgi:hypothetical protein